MPALAHGSSPILLKTLWLPHADHTVKFLIMRHAKQNMYTCAASPLDHGIQWGEQATNERQAMADEHVACKGGATPCQLQLYLYHTFQELVVLMFSEDQSAAVRQGLLVRGSSRKKCTNMHVRSRSCTIRLEHLPDICFHHACSTGAL